MLEEVEVQKCLKSGGQGKGLCNFDLQDDLETLPLI